MQRANKYQITKSKAQVIVTALAFEAASQIPEPKSPKLNFSPQSCDPRVNPKPKAQSPGSSEGRVILEEKPKSRIPNHK